MTAAFKWGTRRARLPSQKLVDLIRPHYGNRSLKPIKCTLDRDAVPREIAGTRITNQNDALYGSILMTRVGFMMIGLH